MGPASAQDSLVGGDGVEVIAELEAKTLVSRRPSTSMPWYQ